jgi:hypothetical protein
MNILKKLYSKLITTCSKNLWFEYKVKPQILLFIDWFIFPKYRKKNQLIHFIKGHKLIFLFFVIFILWTTGFFSIGRFLSYIDKKKTITVLESKIDRH